MKYTLKKKCILPLFIVSFLAISEMLSPSILFLKYADEIVAVWFVIYLLFSAFSRNKISKVTSSSMITIIIIISIGVVSNILCKIQVEIWPIVLDIVTAFKLFISFWGVYEMVVSSNADYILRKCLIYAKCFLWGALLFGVCSVFIDVGMRGERRFGLYAYRFIYSGAHIYAMAVLSSVIIVIYSCKIHERSLYICIAAIQMLLTTKGPSIIWAVIIFPLIHYVKKYNKITIKDIIKIVIAGLVLGRYQMSNYILNKTAPRFLLYKYGLETAFKYFPHGSGFATFGSNMSVVYYSQLYYEYGIANRWGMSQNSPMFLNDNYWPMVIGQFGFIGLIFFGVLFYAIFRVMQKSKIERVKKAIIISAFVYLMIHSLGSSTPATSSAVTMMIIIALTLKASESNVEGKIRYELVTNK